MKHKKIIGLGVILASGLVVAPHFLGNIAKKNIDHQAELISQIPGYSLNVISYDQGWFTSHAVMRYGFDDHSLSIFEKSAATGSGFDQQVLSALKQGLNFDVTIAHGPITFQKGVHFALLTLSGNLQDIDHNIYRDFKESTKLDSLLSLFAAVSFGGDTDITATSPAFTFEHPDPKTKKDVTLNFGGATAQTQINSTQNHYDSMLDMPEITLSAAATSLSFTALSIQASGTKINDYLWLGKGSLSLKEFNIKGPNNEVAFSLNNFTSDYDLQKQSDTNLSLHFGSSLETFIAPDFTANNVLLDMDMTHLDLQGLTEYVKFIHDFYGNLKIDGQSSEQKKAEMLAITSRIGEKILKNSPEITIHHLDLSLNGGATKNTAKLSFNGDQIGDTSFNIEQLSDPAILNKRLEALATISFDHKFASAVMTEVLRKQMATLGADTTSLPKEQIEKMVSLQTSTVLQNFITQGYLIKDKEHYSSYFEMKDGQRTINAKKLP